MEVLLFERMESPGLLALSYLHHPQVDMSIMCEEMFTEN